MTGPVRVAVLDDYQGVAATYADWAERLPEARVEYVRDHVADPDRLVELLTPFDVVVVMRERTPLPRAVLERLPALRLLVTTGMRNASIDLAAARERGVVVCGTRGHPWSTAELTWALILGLMRNVAGEDARVRAGGWQQEVGRDLVGETLGVVGLGKQGAHVAAVGAAFGMDVVAWSPHLTEERAEAGGARLVGRDELFATARVVTLHLVLSDSTRGIVDEAALRLMRPDAYLVNTARALLVDQAALRTALEEGWIAGAGLDVFEVEPLPPDHWLRAAPRTLLSPHMGYVSDRNYQVFYGDAVEDVRAFLDGAPVRVL
ncbi:D-2-hydroxyacid dehydrogenase family protein [Jiangella mangrovi]|uniref:Phosphoglycerate dehydrogenase-like enzyme n=1 Tax=Jiangella mangrovi TaxID=1524084 RepID=A0A7W9GPC9_9ACTN|nr:D-2-hydroxyacid dehydrogenase family protein [Jiangella mangrovi]MBB5787251.1 phosphoglycerate dehydrogenase-like enzyme [Jiangella mangrovi]